MYILASEFLSLWHQKTERFILKPFLLSFHSHHEIEDVKVVLLVLAFVAVVFGEQQLILNRPHAAWEVEEKGCAGAGSTCYVCAPGCRASQPCAGVLGNPYLLQWIELQLDR